MMNILPAAPINRLETVIKRDGSTQPFKSVKIFNAVYRCFVNGCNVDPDAATDAAMRVEYHLMKQCDGFQSLGVEEIQDLVGETLFALGFMDAAFAYIIYRQQHEKLRALAPMDVAESERIDSNRKYFPQPIQQFQFYSKYSRWNEIEARRETWEECCERVLEFFRSEFENVLSHQEWDELYQGMLQMEAFPSMRSMQMAGPAAKRCHICCFNCAYKAIDSISSFNEILYVLMQGTGVGFSVEYQYVRQLPRVALQDPLASKVKIIVEDSTEGWCDTLFACISQWMNGADVHIDDSGVRPQGARLLVKGGRASGPEPLRQLLEFTRSRILARQGEYLTTQDCHDIACMCGWIVQVGGVRRAAMISLSDLHDVTMRGAKIGEFWIENPQRAMANNSAVYTRKPTTNEFLTELLSLIESESGERGLFNRGSARKQIPSRRALTDFGVNPCGEVWLRNRGLCNLSISVARAGDTVADLTRKVRLATIWGTLQSALTRFNYLPDEWKQNAEEERLLGVDITGQMDCEPLRPHASGREALLEQLKKLVITTNVEFADRLGINPSVATTVVKPSGNSAQLLGCSSGLHARYATYYLRRVRGGAFDPLSWLLKDSGVPCHPEVGSTWENASVWVFEFPCKSPDGAITRDDMNAIDQLRNWLMWKVHYTEHNPSATIYVASDEWVDVANWLWNHWDQIGGLSFLPKEDSDHVYQLAPYETLTEEEYFHRVKAFPEVDYSKMARYEKEDRTTVAQEYACVSGSCDL